MVKFLEDRDNNCANMEARSPAKLAVCQNLMVNVDGRGMWRRRQPFTTRLEAQLHKALQLKQGVMQQLLNGEFTAGEAHRSSRGKAMKNYYCSWRGLPHRRQVKWLPTTIERIAMSESLQKSTGSIGTVSTITSHAPELETFLSTNVPQTLIATDPVIEAPWLLPWKNTSKTFWSISWKQTVLAKNFEIYEDDGELIGQQYATDAGPIDILAISKDKRNCWWWN